ncbi:transmembrane protein [Thalictrum thalictroides]|uniref:Transmembrane protein n=1 Tax=Thalictrum thalictroides TaxID=46969 RepID=A0A7J6X724_THATH|nr:transmembrane protein [Thalictrum thalictroides]
MVLAAYLIWRYEGSNSSKTEDVQSQQQTRRSIYADEVWMPCVRGIHPAWLLAFRIFGFLMLLGMLITDVVVDGFGIFFFYTQWTFALVTIYFGLGSLLSIYGCRQYFIKVDGNGMALDTEQGTYVAPTYDENGNTCNIDPKKYVLLQHNRQYYVRQTAGNWGHVFQVLFQMNAGAVIITDCVFWFIIYPFLTTTDHSLTALKIVTHSVNAIFLIGDTVLNCLEFPWFRMAYFILWTATFVIFQWVVHAFVSIEWPYPILELSSPYAPLWYLMVALMHLPSYGFFYLLIKLKGYFLSRCIPQSYQFLS